MTIAELRHHAWNYGQLAKSAELNALHASTEGETDLWNNTVLMLEDCAAAFEGAADLMERQGEFILEVCAPYSETRLNKAKAALTASNRRMRP